MTKEEMCLKCQEKFKDTFDKEKCKTCEGLAFVKLIDNGLELLDYINKNSDAIARIIVKQYFSFIRKEENINNDLVRKSD